MRLPFLIIGTIFALLAAVESGELYCDCGGGHWAVCGQCPQPQPHCQCGIGKVSAIVLGINARTNEFPWQVLLKITNREDNDYRCGGTVLNKRFVITAAHCTHNVKRIVAVVGEHDLSNR